MFRNRNIIGKLILVFSFSLMIEQIQKSWLDTPKQKFAYAITAIFFGWFVGTLFGLLGTSISFTKGWAVWLTEGPIFALMGGVIGIYIIFCCFTKII